MISRESGSDARHRGQVCTRAFHTEIQIRPARLHWGIENGFHRCLDVAFREDTSAIWLRNTAANFALLRRFALSLFRLDATRTKSLPRKRKAAAWISRYVVKLLNLQPLQQDRKFDAPALSGEGERGAIGASLVVN